MMDIEICIDSYNGALSALHYGAKRVELCSSLNDGGTTPSYAMIKKCSELVGIEVHVMIRPRAGDFVYSEDELLIMKENIIAAANAGAKGVVFGVLDDKNEVDIQANMFLLESVFHLKLEATYHRAIDICENPLNGLENIINMGFNRILTSGMKEKAIDGLAHIKEFVLISNGRIEIMAGSGVNSSNAMNLAKSGVNALHFTARKIEHNEETLKMGTNYVVDSEKIKSISDILS